VATLPCSLLGCGSQQETSEAHHISLPCQQLQCNDMNFELLCVLHIRSIQMSYNFMLFVGCNYQLIARTSTQHRHACASSSCKVLLPSLIAFTATCPSGILNGGILSTLLDCHGNWTAAIALMDRSCLPKPPLTLTASMLVSSSSSSSKGITGSGHAAAEEEHMHV
jgi:hypothetical protein